MLHMHSSPREGGGEGGGEREGGEGREGRGDLQQPRGQTPGEGCRQQTACTLRCHLDIAGSWPASPARHSSPTELISNKFITPSKL